MPHRPQCAWFYSDPASVSLGRAMYKLQLEATAMSSTTVQVRAMNADELSAFLARQEIAPENIYARDRYTANSYLAKQAGVCGVAGGYTPLHDDLLIIGEEDTDTHKPVYLVHLIQTRRF